MKTLPELLQLCLDINRDTELAVFFHFSGHVDEFSVHVCYDKHTRYTEHLYGRPADMYKPDDVENITRIYADLERLAAL